MQVKKSHWELLVKVGLMVGAMAAVGLAFWNPLSSEVRSQTRRITTTLARAMQTDILDEVRYQMLALVRLASLLSLEPRPVQGEWETQTKLFMSHHPGYIAVQWIDTEYRTRWMASEDDRKPFEDVPFAANEPFRHALDKSMNHCDSDAAFTPTFRLANGNPGRRIIVPICREQEFLGFLVAVLDEPRVLSEILADDTGLGYGIAVLDGDTEVFSAPGRNSRNDKKWGQETQVPLLGATWRVRVWPESDLLHEIESRLPEQALLMGSIIGLLLFTTLDFARTSYFRSRELHRAHNELESRVEQRTTELRLANKELESQIHERKRAEESLQELSARLLQLRDEEQRRIARELHDSTVQLMGALAIDLEKVQQLLPQGDSAKLRKLLTDSRELVERGTVELRTISYLLHPPILDDLGLEGVLPWYAAGFSSRSGIKVNVKLQSNLGRLPHEVELTVFRIVQESLTNIHRHSESPTAEISVVCDSDRVALQVVDHGRGIPRGILKSGASAGAVVGVGIAGMRERVRQLGGQLKIDSGSSGTSLTVTLPIATATPGRESDRKEFKDITKEKSADSVAEK